MKPKYSRLATPGSAWYWPIKEFPERDAAQELIQGLAEPGICLITGLRRRHETHPPTPPDCIAVNELGGHIGIEVTELTSKEAKLSRSATKKYRGPSMWIGHCQW